MLFAGLIREYIKNLASSRRIVQVAKIRLVGRLAQQQTPDLSAEIPSTRIHVDAFMEKGYQGSWTHDVLDRIFAAAPVPTWCFIYPDWLYGDH